MPCLSLKTVLKTSEDATDVTILMFPNTMMYLENNSFFRKYLKVRRYY